MKLGIIVDSGSNFTEIQAKESGWYFIPLIIYIDQIDYRDGIELDDKKFDSLIHTNAIVSTAAANPTSIENVFKKACIENDAVIYYPMSLKLSAQKEQAKVLSKNFSNLYIIDSLLVSEIIARECKYAELLAKKGMPIDEIVKTLNERSSKALGYIVPSNLNWLKRGGRINAATAALGNLLNICPIIKYDGGLHKMGKARTTTKALIKGLEILLKDFKKGKLSVTDFYFVDSIFSDDSEYKTKKQNLIKTIEKEYKIEFIDKFRIPRIIAIHTYLDALAIIAMPKMNLES